MQIRTIHISMWKNFAQSKISALNSLQQVFVFTYIWSAITTKSNLKCVNATIFSVICLYITPFKIVLQIKHIERMNNVKHFK